MTEVAVVDVVSWLTGLGLATYAKVFSDNAIDEDVLADLTDADLQQLDIPLGHRKKLLKAIEALKVGHAQDAAHGDAVLAQGQPSASPSTQAERRQLTLMFVDLVGSTELSLKLDPEELRDVTRAYQDATAREVSPYGGHVAKYMGDGILVYFGYPHAHEDDAVRAIYAGLAITRAVKQLGKQNLAVHGGRLRARVGVATGIVVVGDLVGSEGSEAGAVMGETPNLAFRLQSLAHSGEVVVADRTRLLAGDAFAYGAPEEQTAKGFPDPVRLWRVLGPSGAESRFEALHGRWLTPLVGREHELALLLERWRQAREGEGQVVLVSGEAGIGKSRIIEVLRERVMAGEHLRIRLQCSPYHMNSALHPVIEHLERAATFEREDDPEARVSKLEASLGQAGVNLSEAMPLIAALLSLSTGDRYPPLAMSPERQKEQTLLALTDQVMGLAGQKPVLMIVEDAHWIDPTTAELIDLIVGQTEGVRLFVVVTTRPEYRPSWLGRPNATMVTLNRLSKRQGAELVKGITGGRALPPEVLEQVVAKTDGVPLFVEELTRMVVESGLVRQEAGRFVLDGPLPPLAIPATLHDSLMARLDRLAPAKEVAQAGAAIGRTFRHDLLAAVLTRGEAELKAALDQLVEAGLIFRQGVGVDATYTFKHALVQDAAHESLLKSQRQRLHARIATVLESLFPEAAAAAPEVVAQHYTEVKLAEPAIRWWTRAGQQATNRSANKEAISTLRKALALIDAESNRAAVHELEIDVLSILGPAVMAVFGYQGDETAAVYERARKLCSESNDSARVCPILYGIWVHHWLRAQLRDARDIVETYRKLSRQSNDLGLRSAGHSMAAQQLSAEGKLAESITEYRSCIDLYDPDRDRAIAFSFGEHPASVSRSMGGYALWFLGYPDQAMHWAQEGVRLAQEASHVNTIAHSMDWVGMIQYHRQEYDASFHTWADLEAYGSEQSLAHFSLKAAGFCQGIRFYQDPTSERAAALRQSVAAHRALGGRILDWIWASISATTFLKAPNLGDAVQTVDDAIDAMRQTGEGWYLPELYRIRGEALAAKRASNWGEAQASLVRALEMAQEQEAKSLELRAAMNLARLWAERGERPRAHDLLAPVYGWFTEGFDTHDLTEAKALLDELG